MCNCKHSCTIVQQIQLSAGTLNLPDNSRIRDGKIRSIMTRRSGSLTLYDSNGNQVAADSVVAGMHLQVYNGNNTLIAEMPLTQIQRDYNAPEPYRVAWENVEPTSCKLITKTTASGYNSSHTIELIWELACDQCGIIVD